MSRILGWMPSPVKKVCTARLAYRMSCGEQTHHRLRDYVRTLEEVRKCHL
jgi:hypothetical protein